ncbi:predicted protein [Naegleria gruberi]|uniref:Predicted protein n=1 Tax=Naegleria gruberi TaxID=5762 RepID=D2VJF3_NAEGR|nr:uncharacterized protein NAEGRDRAFT_69019 [Naegleria gruberi]EFC43030.1 predicted protein [Naegleria gruberi]|eukprot:XP_002675774.1 predicted protein [Naegleria gruberi strain NEG-M]
MDIGDLGPLGQVGWYIPNWMAIDNPLSLNYRYYRTVNATRYISGAKTWVNFDEQVIKNLKLNLVLEYPPQNYTEKFLIQELRNAERERKQLVSYFFTPHQLFSRPNAPQRVTLPPFTAECVSPHNVENNLVDCDFAMTTYSKLQTRAVLSFPEKVQNFLERMKLTNADQIELLGLVSYDKMSKEDAACTWILKGNNTERWKSWISEPPFQPEKSNAFIISMTVVGFTLAIILIGFCVFCCGFCIRKNSIRKRENRLAPKAPPICIVFTHIQNASLLWTLDSDLMKKVVTIHHKIVRDNIRKFKGYEVKTQSDSFMIAFSDPIEAIGCCFAIQNDLLKGNWTPEMLEFPDMKEVKWNNEIIYKGPRVRMGLHYGSEVEAHFDPTTKRYDYFGTTVNQASRTENQAQGGRIYICSNIHDHLKHQMGGASRCNICMDKGFPIHKDPIFQFKQLLYSGKIQFENMGNFILKGLEGNHTLFWIMDTTSPRTSYIQQFELLPHVRIDSGLSVPLLREKIDKERMELKQSCASCISDPSKWNENEKSKLLHRLVLWNNDTEEEKDAWTELELKHLIPIVISHYLPAEMDNIVSDNKEYAYEDTIIRPDNRKRRNSVAQPCRKESLSSSSSIAVMSCPEELIQSGA